MYVCSPDWEPRSDTQFSFSGENWQACACVIVNKVLVCVCVCVCVVGEGVTIKEGVDSVQQY